jgi:hypothetical protein
MRWAGHVARMRERKPAYFFWWGKLGERVPLEDLGLDGRTILKWIRLMDRINLFQDMGRCRGVVTTIMNVLVSQNAWSYLTC